MYNQWYYRTRCTTKLKFIGPFNKYSKILSVLRLFRKKVTSYAPN